MFEFSLEQKVVPNLLCGTDLFGVVVGCLDRAYGQVPVYEVEWADTEGRVNSR